MFTFWQVLATRWAGRLNPGGRVCRHSPRRRRIRNVRHQAVVGPSHVPPLASIETSVIYCASDEARKETMSAMSPGCLSRPHSMFTFWQVLVARWGRAP